jgi:galactose-1-phosphate uridylyltransferase
MREDEVHGIVRNKSNFLDFDDNDWESLADGISRVFKYYKGKGFSSCNLALYSAPLGEKLDYFWAGVRIISRSSVQAQPINDAWYSQNILYDGLVTEPPEEIASSLRNYF